MGGAAAGGLGEGASGAWLRVAKGGSPPRRLILFMTYAFHAASRAEKTGPPHLYAPRRAGGGRTAGGLIGGLRVEPDLGTPVARAACPRTVGAPDGRRLGDQAARKIYFDRIDGGSNWFRGWWAKTDEEEPPRGAIFPRPGRESPRHWHRFRAWDHLGIARATVSHEITFENTPGCPARPLPWDVSRRLRKWAALCERAGRKQPGNATGRSRRSTMGVAGGRPRDWLRDYLKEADPDQSWRAARPRLPALFRRKFGENRGRCLHVKQG